MSFSDNLNFLEIIGELLEEIQSIKSISESLVSFSIGESYILSCSCLISYSNACK